MKTIQKLSLLVMALTLASCNEKVSPELLQSNAVTPGSSTPVPPQEYYFRVVNTSDTLLNYKLHKSGPGNANTKCEIKNTTGMSSDIFRGNPVANDITCFFEAEELSLFHGGFSFAIEASRNTCDYIGYSPFGFYDKIPGDSSDSFLQVTCEGDSTTASHASDAAAAMGLNIQDSLGTNIGCNDWVTTNITDIPVGTRQRFAPSSDEELCRFNYSEDKCDVGTIHVSELVVNYTPATPEEPSILKYEIVPRTISCGGRVENCVKGPIKEMTTEYARFTEITQNVLNQESSVEYKYEGIIGKRNTNMSYANFRRNLANVNIDFNTSSGLTPAYKSIWSDPLYNKVFQTRLLDYYSSNVMMDNSGDTLVPPTVLQAEAVKSNKWKAVPLAAEPFVGLSERINPFYTMYCLDTAFDIKARVRMVVRDWDRVFSSNNEELELLSDLFKGANSKQDAPNYVELPDDLDGVIPFNDRKDWDDQIPMNRDIGSFNPSMTIWRPTPTVTYPHGWFNPARFPSGF